MSDFLFDRLIPFLGITAIFIVGSILCFFLMCLPFCFIAESEYRASFLNEKFGTKYTTSDMFWKGGAIMEMNAYQIPEKPKTIVIKKGE